MKRSVYILFALVTLLATGAKAQPAGNFPYAQIPNYIATHEAAMEWLVSHWWDNYDFSASPKRYTPEANKRGFMEFISSLYATSDKHSFESIEKMMKRAAVNEEAYWYFLEMAEDVLYAPQSPLRNDLLWEVFVRHAVGTESPLDEPSKVRYRSMLKLVSRNQQGSPATDFIFTLPDGSQRHLYDIKAPFTVIFFYNPGCSGCSRIKEQIVASGYLEILHQKGVVEVLALHPDEDLTEWRRRLHEMPKEWIVAYDKGQKIDREGLYDIKAIPTIYLLDEEKRVLMKDPEVEDFLQVIEQLMN